MQAEKPCAPDPTSPPRSAGTDLEQEIEELRARNLQLSERNRELVETLDAIRRGEVDAIVVAEDGESRVYTLEGAEHPYRVLVERIQEGALTLTTAGLILFANEAFARMLGHPLSAVLGTPLEDHISPRDRERFVALLGDACTVACRGELRICSGTGTMPVALSLTPIEDRDRTTISAVVADRREDYDRLRLQGRMLDSVVDAVTAVDRDGTIIYWNDAAARLYGWTAEEMVGRPVAETFDPGLLEENEWRFFEQLLTGRAWSGEHMAVHRDGHRFPVQAAQAPVYDEDGTLIAIIGTSQDITERKAAEAALKESEERFRLALRNAPTAVFHQDADLRYTWYGNPHPPFSATDLLGSTDADLMPPEDAAPITALKQEVLATGESRRGEVSVTADGAPTYYDLAVEPKKDAHGRTVGVMGVSHDITQRKVAEETLRESEERFRAVFEQSRDAIILTDPTGEGRILAANPAACRMLGWPEEELIGQNRGCIFDPADAEVPALLQRRARNGSAGAELRYRRRDGSTFPGEVTTALFTDSRGDVCSVAIIRDVTQRKEAEEALAESERRYRELFEAMTEGFALHEVVLDAAGRPVDYRILTVNPAFGTATGLASEGIVGRRILELQPDIDPVWIERYGRVALTGEPERFVEHYPALGRWFDIYAFSPAYGQFATIVRDITVEREAEEALSESEDRYRSLIENSIDAVLLTSPDGSILAANAEARRIFGMTEEEIVRGGRAAIIDPSDPRLAAALEERARTGRFRGELTFRRGDGTTFPGEVSTALFTDRSGAVRTTMIIRDISEQKAAETALKEYAGQLKTSNEELQRFAYVASHDLQEPLRSIVSFSQLLARRYMGRLDSDADEFIGFIVEGGNRMQTLIRDLLQVSRVETQAKSLEPTDPAGVVADAVRSLEVPLRETGASVTVGDLPAVMADAAQLEQVFTNLVGNAVKYRRDGVPPAIAISAERTDGMVEFAVSDNGIGIEAEYFDQIFEMFRRLHTHDEYEGTGIGLAVVKRIVDRHGGTIRVESSPGQGSSFRFTLPAA